MKSILYCAIKRLQGIAQETESTLSGLRFLGVLTNNPNKRGSGSQNESRSNLATSSTSLCFSSIQYTQLKAKPSYEYFSIQLKASSDFIAYACCSVSLFIFKYFCRRACSDLCFSRWVSFPTGTKISNQIEALAGISPAVPLAYVFVSDNR